MCLKDPEINAIIIRERAPGKNFPLKSGWEDEERRRSEPNVVPL